MLEIFFVILFNSFWRAAAVAVAADVPGWIFSSSTVLMFRLSAWFASSFSYYALNLLAILNSQCRFWDFDIHNYELIFIAQFIHRSGAGNVFVVVIFVFCHFDLHLIFISWFCDFFVGVVVVVSLKSLSVVFWLVV